MNPPTEQPGETSGARKKQHGQWVRLSLLLLLLAAGAVAYGVLSARRELEGLRRTVVAEAESRLGIRLGFDAVRLEGVSGIVIQNAQAKFGSPEKGLWTVDAPRIRVTVNLAELLSGNVSLGQVELEKAVVETVLAPSQPSDGGEWWQKLPSSLDPAALPAVPPLPFRVIGRECALRVINGPGDAPIVVAPINFDISQQPGAVDKLGRLSLALEGQPGLGLDATVRFANFDDFDVRARLGTVTRGALAGFFPGLDKTVLSGTLNPSLTLSGHPGGLVMLALDTEITEFSLVEQPGFLPPLTGTLRGTTTFDMAAGQLVVQSARLDSEYFSGNIKGTVSLGREAPELDLRLESEKLPLDPVIAHYLPQLTEKYGKAGVEISPPYQFSASVKGRLPKPVLSIGAEAAGAKLRFGPKTKGLPPAFLTLGPLKVAWDSEKGQPSGTVLIADGGIEKPYKGVALGRLSANVMLADGMVRLEPFSAEVNGQPFMGRAAGDIAKKTVDFSIAGTIRDIEKTPLHNLDKELFIYGAVGARASGTISPEKMIFEASADATMAKIDFEWWLRKPVHTGAVIHTITAEIIPKKTLTIRGEASVDETRVVAALDYKWGKKGKFENHHLRVELPSLDIDTGGRCINIPYTATGGTVTDGFYEMNAAGNWDGGTIVTIGGVFDQVSMLADGCTVPLECTNARVSVTMDNSMEDTRTGLISIHADDAHVPPFSEKWMLPLEPADYVKPVTPGEENKPPEPTRTWKYTLSADNIALPPWKGTQFKGDVYDNGPETGLSHFEALVDGGRIAGSYRHEDESNVMNLKAESNGVPSVYIARQIGLPELLEGRVTGTVDYTMDLDDPNTLDGTAKFDVRDGHFYSDELAERFGESFAGGMRSLHPSALKFSSFSSDVALKGDHIRTDNVAILMDGMSIKGGGTWITDGDIDYTLTLSMTPETAAQIPLMQSSFNLEGYRIANRTIDLGFHITGPAFKPTSQIAGLPSMGVTLVSGAAEMTSDTVKIIDLPRQLFISVLKTGGGLLGASRQQQQGGNSDAPSP